MSYALKSLSVILCCVVLGCSSTSHFANTDKRAEDVRSSRSREYITDPAFAQKLDRIKTGDTYRHVVDLLGPPTIEQEMVRKERPESLGRALTYILYQRNKDSLNDKTDRYAEIFVDTHLRVTRMVKFNIE